MVTFATRHVLPVPLVIIVAAYVLYFVLMKDVIMSMDVRDTTQRQCTHRFQVSTCLKLNLTLKFRPLFIWFQVSNFTFFWTHKKGSLFVSISEMHSSVITSTVHCHLRCLCTQKTIVYLSRIVKMNKLSLQEKRLHWIFDPTLSCQYKHYANGQC